MIRMERDRKRSRAADGGGSGEVCVKKRTGVAILDLNTVPDEGE
ncbi:hypothetical protein HanRHA438_Chr14g0673901 [Helianthus annuus]|nr:hypothetical protein HanRHA438_Chr14g0673901 [Helianthus annuus]